MTGRARKEDREKRHIAAILPEPEGCDHTLAIIFDHSAVDHHRVCKDV